MLRQEDKKQQKQEYDNIDELLYRNFVNALKSKITKSNYTRL
jgi:hypothetical protein